MKFDKLDYNNSKRGRWFLYGFLMCAVLLIIINMFLTKAKYKVVDSTKLVNSTINYSNADFSLIAIYLQDGTNEEPKETYKKVEDGLIPTKNVVFNEKETYCKIEETELKGKDAYNKEGINITINGNTVDFTGIKQAGTKCYLYFDLIPKGNSEKTKDKLNITPNGVLVSSDIKGTACEKNTNNSNHNGGNCTNEENGIYEVEGDGGKSYVYRGTVNNNWVKFAGMWWRIIRINENGTIRLIYSGSNSSSNPPKLTGTASKPGVWASDSDTQTTTSAFNTNESDNKYVGFMYGGTKSSGASTSYEEAHENNYSSTIKEKIDTWYTNSELNKYENLLDGSTGFCNDREKATGLGYGRETTNYKAGKRFTSTPSLICENKSRDLFTTKKEKGDGNGALDIPVGLITSDEIMFAGGYGNSYNYGYWLHTNSIYWTMSPHNASYNAWVIWVNNDGGLTLGGSSVGWTVPGIRPVINLKSTVNFEEKGTGTIDNPYVVQ